MKIKRNFSLRQALIGFGVCGVVLGYIAHKAALQRDIADAVARFGGDVSYDCDVPASSRTGSVFQRLANLVGRNLAAKIVVIDALKCNSRDELHALLRHASDLGSLEYLLVGGPAINDETIRLIGDVESLEFLSIGGSRQLDTSPLRNLRNLKTLSLPSSSGVSRESLRALAGLPQLVVIDLSYSDLSDETIVELQGFSHLKELDITCTPVTSAGLMSLRGARKLQSVTASAGLADGNTNDAAIKTQMPGVDFIFD